MRLGTLLGRDLARSRRRLTMVSVAVAASVAVVVLFVALGLGLHQNVVAPLLPRLPLDLLHVEPRTVSVGLLAFDSGKLLGGGLDAQAVERLRRIEGVQKVYPVVSAAFPMHAEGGEGFLGRRLRTDVFATGVDPELVQKDIARGYSFEDRAEGKIPVLVSRRLLDLYNTTVAPAIEKPRLSAEMVVGFEFQITLGASYSRGTPDPDKVGRVVAQVVGVSDQATLVGITVPAATLQRWNAAFGRPESPISGAYVKTTNPAAAGPVARAVEQAGLQVDETPKIVGAALTIAGVLGGLFAGTLLVLSAFGIGQTFFLLVAERRLELAILRALGARRRDLRRLVLIEAAVVGLLGGVVGTALGALAASGLDALVVNRLPDLPFKPSSLVALPPGLLLGAVLLGVAAALLGAAVPAAQAAAANPASALRT